MKVLIVGAGVTGLAVAYNLARMGARDIKVIDRGLIGHGTSTRAGARFRVHFWAEENVRFAKESIKRLVRLGRVTGWNPIIDYGGYLWLLSSEEDIKEFRKANEMWRRLRVGGEFLEPEELKHRYPYLNINGILEAFFGPQDGKFHHDYVTYGYYWAGKKMGVKYHEHVEAHRIILKDGRVKGVETSRGKIETEVLVLAAAERTNILLKTIGIVLPVEALRKEVIITEPYKYFIDPLIVDWGSTAYVGQTIRGEILGGIDVPVKPGLIGLETTFYATSEWAKAAIKRIPVLRHARIMRTWSGYFASSKDESHIMGRDPEWPEGLYVAFGYSGHGFMMAPLVGELLADNILHGKIHELMKPFLPTRFKEGKLIPEKLVIGGGRKG